MSDLVGLFNLLAPFFGLIGLGFVCAKVVRRPEGGLAWMQFFLIYVALPCLFYKLIADKPLEQLANWPFVMATTLSHLLRLRALLRGRHVAHPLGHAASGHAGRRRLLLEHRLHGPAADPLGARTRRRARRSS